MKNTQNANEIFFVSRLDDDCSFGAELLCNIAPRLAREIDELQIIIIGGGTEFERLNQKAKIINMQTERKNGQKLVTLIGGVSTPKSHFHQGALFVGVSRAALEAMSEGLAVLLLGNEGCLGLLDKNNLQIAIKTNFTCRHKYCEFPTQKSIENHLFNEIMRYFSLSNKDKERLSELSLKIVAENYTADKMAARTLNVYKEVTEIFANSSQKVAICGYYGHGNLGDEAILRIITEHIKKISPRADIFIVNPKSPIDAIIALQGAELFIFGGGSLLQNATSDLSLLCYLAIIKLAGALCKRKIMLSNGFGPIITRHIPRALLLQAIKNTVKTFDYISVRDKNSQISLKALLPNKKINLIPDPVYEILPQISNNIVKKSTQNSQNSSYIAYIPNSRALHISKLSTEQICSALTDLANQSNASLLIAVMNNEDIPLAREICKKTKSAQVILSATAEDLCKALSDASLTITQRYHGALISLSLGIPTIALSTDPKIVSLSDDFEHYFINFNPKIIKNNAFLSKKASVFLKKLSKNDEKTTDINQKRAQVEEKIDAIIKKYL